MNCHTFSPTKSGKKNLTTALNSFWYVYSDSMGVLSNLTPVTISIQKSEVLKKNVTAFTLRYYLLGNASLSYLFGKTDIDTKNNTKRIIVNFFFPENDCKTQPNNKITIRGVC